MEMDAKNVKEVELEFSRKLDNALADILQDLGYSLPQSHQVKTSLLDSNGRKKRSNAAADNWSPMMGGIEIPDIIENSHERVSRESREVVQGHSWRASRRSGFVDSLGSS